MLSVYFYHVILIVCSLDRYIWAHFPWDSNRRKRPQ